MTYEFHNPYNFVRTPAREKALPLPFAGDHDPSRPESRENYSRYWSERYTGEIPVRLRTVTPLFITKAFYKSMRELPATALKGMLSSAYEIITNSRYRVFSENQHGRRLGYRYSANASLVPAMVTEKDGQLMLELFTGTSDINGQKGTDRLLYAAWLPTYKNARLLHNLKNGQFYTRVQLGLYKYKGRPFKFWLVEKINGIVLNKITNNAERERPGDPNTTIFKDGYAVISGKTIINKHDERFFFNNAPDKAIFLPISDEVKESYEALIKDYQEVHREVNGKIQNDAQAGTILGRHITDEAELTLRAGRFVYAMTDGKSLKAIYPVQISRELCSVSPWECLDDSLKPAKEPDDKIQRKQEALKNLSPADRLFGWISHKGSGAWKGKVRISCGVCGGKNPVIKFSTPLHLSILGGPKPAQARFYLGDEKGMPQKDHISKQNVSYIKGKKIRGRKVYLHHTLQHLKSKEEREDYWNPESNNKSIIREYSTFSAGVSEESNQNRSITGWIPKKTDFNFKIRFENLTREELGALLKLLSMDQECNFRLGFGKPLGLGSVKLSVVWDENDSIPVMTGENMRERYMKLGSNAVSELTLTKVQAQKIIQDYQKSMAEAYGEAETLQSPALSPLETELAELMSYYNEEQKKDFKNAWLKALDRGASEAPLAEIPESDTIQELLESEPDMKKKFDELYKADIKALQNFVKQDFGWSKISFIKDFIDSMKGFKEPVTYPRNSNKSGEEGFKWFVENERTNKGLPQGYSLPLMGKTLSGFN